jgi:hypothetical protein
VEEAGRAVGGKFVEGKLGGGWKRLAEGNGSLLKLSSQTHAKYTPLQSRKKE